MTTKTDSRTKHKIRKQYLLKLGEIRREMTRIEEGIDALDVRALKGDDPHYGHVGDLGSYLSRLTDIADSLHGTGEYAE